MCVVYHICTILQYLICPMFMPESVSQQPHTTNVFGIYQNILCQKRFCPSYSTRFAFSFCDWIRNQKRNVKLFSSFDGVQQIHVKHLNYIHWYDTTKAVTYSISTAMTDVNQVRYLISKPNPMSSAENTILYPASFGVQSSTCIQ